MYVAPNPMRAALDALEIAFPDWEFAIFGRDENAGDEYLILAIRNQVEVSRTGWCPTPCIARAEMADSLKALKRSKH